MRRHTVAAMVRCARRLDAAVVRYDSIEGCSTWSTVYTPGDAGGWSGPERWSVTRSGAYVAGMSSAQQRGEDDVREIA